MTHSCNLAMATMAMLDQRLRDSGFGNSDPTKPQKIAGGSPILFMLQAPKYPKSGGNLLKSVAGSGRPVQDKQSLISSSHGRKNQPGVIFVM
jgi:hypothetical protein